MRKSVRFSLLSAAAAVGITASLYTRPILEYVLGKKHVYKQAGEMAPKFSLETTDGRCAELRNGRTAIVSFWATWCAPCVAELPEFEKLFLNNADADVILVNVTDGKNVTREFLSAYGYTIPSAIDMPKKECKSSALVCAETFDAYGGNYSLPYTCAVTPCGRISRCFGPADYEGLVRELKKAKK